MTCERGSVDNVVSSSLRSNSWRLGPDSTPIDPITLNPPLLFNSNSTNWDMQPTDACIGTSYLLVLIAWDLVGHNILLEQERKFYVERDDQQSGRDCCLQSCGYKRRFTPHLPVPAPHRMISQLRADAACLYPHHASTAWKINKMRIIPVADKNEAFTHISRGAHASFHLGSSPIQRRSQSITCFTLLRPPRG